MFYSLSNFFTSHRSAAMPDRILRMEEEALLASFQKLRIFRASRARLRQRSRHSCVDSFQRRNELCSSTDDERWGPFSLHRWVQVCWSVGFFTFFCIVASIFHPLVQLSIKIIRLLWIISSLKYVVRNCEWKFLGQKTIRDVVSWFCSKSLSAVWVQTKMDFFLFFCWSRRSSPFQFVLCKPIVFNISTNEDEHKLEVRKQLKRFRGKVVVFQNVRMVFDTKSITAKAKRYVVSQIFQRIKGWRFTERFSRTFTRS